LRRRLALDLRLELASLRSVPVRVLRRRPAFAPTATVSGEERANQGQLGLNTCVGAVKLKCLPVRLAGQSRIDVTKIFMGCGVAWVGADSHFKRCTGFVELALSCVKHREVVVRLRELRVILRDLREGGDGVVGFTRFSLNHALDESHLRITGLASQILVCLHHRFIDLTGPQHFADISIVISMCQGRR
jgi:hypothetical protein